MVTWKKELILKNVYTVVKTYQYIVNYGTNSFKCIRSNLQIYDTVITFYRNAYTKAPTSNTETQFLVW